MTEKNSQSGENNRQYGHSGEGDITGRDNITININIGGESQAPSLREFVGILPVLLTDPERAEEFFKENPDWKPLRSLLGQKPSQKKLKEEVSKRAQQLNSTGSHLADYSIIKERKWYYLDRQKLREDFEILMEDNAPPGNLNILLLKEEEEALSDELPNMLSTWWRDAELDGADGNIRLEPIQIETTDLKDNQQDSKRWIRRLCKTLHRQDEVFNYKKIKSTEALNQAIRESIVGKETLFLYQRLQNACLYEERLKSYLAFWRETKWLKPTVLVFLINPYHEEVTEKAGACWHCQPKDHYETIDRIKLKDFYEFCEIRREAYQEQLFIPLNQPISLKQAVDNLKQIST